MKQIFDHVHCGDCLELMADLPDGCIDLAYLDPPFNTGRDHSAQQAAYSDRFSSIDDYLAWMTPRLAEIHRVLQPAGSILLHCDWRTSHHLRLVLDHQFGSNHFVNHLIWSYGLGGSSPRRFARKHDDILFYARGDNYYFTPPLVPATSQRMKGQLKKATDVIDIPAINNMAEERLGYPTQKPLALLKLLVEACCPPDGTVLDPYCGSGTTLTAASETGRHYIGFDINPQAVEISQKRLMTLVVTES